MPTDKSACVTMPSIGLLRVKSWECVWRGSLSIASSDLAGRCRPNHLAQAISSAARSCRAFTRVSRNRIPATAPLLLADSNDATSLEESSSSACALRSSSCSSSKSGLSTSANTCPARTVSPGDTWSATIRPASGELIKARLFHGETSVPYARTVCDTDWETTSKVCTSSVSLADRVRIILPVFASTSIPRVGSGRCPSCAGSRCPSNDNKNAHDNPKNQFGQSVRRSACPGGIKETMCSMVHFSNCGVSHSSTETIDLKINPL